MLRLVACAALVLAGAAGCAGPSPLTHVPGPDAGGTSLPDAVVSDAAQGVDATFVSDATLEAFEGIGPMVGVVVCPGEGPGGFDYDFDVTSCWTPTDANQIQTFCHPLNPERPASLRVLVQHPELVVTNAPLPVGDRADAFIIVQVVDSTTAPHALLEATSGTAILDHFEPDPTNPHFGGRLLDIQMTPSPPTGAICRMPTTSFYSR
jgi:hypothetical protein